MSAAPIFDFLPPLLPANAGSLRAEVRDLVARERAAGRVAVKDRIGMAYHAGFSRACGEAGLIGMTWPKRYGGREATAMERYVVTEELLAADAPVRGHWVADRQSGPVILRYGTEAQRERFLPPITRGECFFCIGLSEPDSGSDLAAVRTRAVREGAGWRLNGTKLWTTNAQNSQFMIAICRTTPQDMKDRYHGLSQFIIDLSLPGVSIRPVINMAGGHEFNEVHFEDVPLAGDALLGTLDEGWKQVSAELAYERSGPERWLSTWQVLAELNATLGPALGDEAEDRIGALLAETLTLREMSLSIAGMLERGMTPNLEAAIVKDLGTRFERRTVEVTRDLAELATERGLAVPVRLGSLLASAILMMPAFTIRGGTTEILRGTIARGLGLR
ncbi:acyl-CoA dehydrogenase family protein [Pararhodobacter marinus]|uniref:acyl-CoA dehydrogenase family protein n=1 Tax=Pararhodobacter marinus TaxID=2184063 RepID=UPI003513EEB6